MRFVQKKRSYTTIAVTCARIVYMISLIMKRTKTMEEFCRNKIIKVESVDYKNLSIIASITTKQYDRLTTKRYVFSLECWAETVERGYIDDKAN